jgi:hypothetical protein
VAHRNFDPLDVIPTPETVRACLAESQLLTERLRILLDVSERLRLPLTTADRLPAVPAEGKGADRG